MAARARKGAYLAACPRCGLSFVKCRVPNCPNQSRAIRLCDAHYLRLRRYGDVLASIPIGAGNGAFAGIVRKTG